jgi:tetratricopeptide (TPR) repeat protein
MRLKFLVSVLVIFLVGISVAASADPVSEATEMIDHRQLDNAITLLKGRIQSDPSYAELYYLLGKAYYLKGDYGNAEKELQNCLDRKRKQEDAQITLALVYVAQQKWDQAKEIITEGVAKSKARKGPFLDALGLYHLARKEFTEADLAFRRAMIEDPTSLLYKRHLADLNYENSVYGVAVDLYREVLTTDSTDVIALFKLGSALFKQKMFSDALKSFSNTIRLDSSYVEAYQGSGDIYMILGLNAAGNGSENGEATSSKSDDLFKNAIWMYSRYLKLGGKENSDIDYRLGQAYYYVKAYPTAIEYLDKVIATGSAKSLGYSLKAKALFRLRKYDEAQAAYKDYETKITKGDPNYQWSAEDFEFFRERALTYNSLYDDTKKDGAPDSSFLELAIPDYLKAFELKGKDIEPLLYGKLATCYYTLKNYQEAIPWYEKKVTIDTADVRSCQYLAYCYIGVKNTAKAVEVLTRVTEMSPKACGIYQSLANIYLQDLKDRKQAEKWFAKWGQCDSISYVPYKSLGYLAITEKPPRKETAIETLLKAARRMEAAGIDPCKDIDVTVWLAQANSMFDDEAHNQETLKWAKRGLKCDPNNETLKNLKESLE